MQNTKLYLLLQSFSPQEIQRFQLYLQSPFFNTDTSLFNLFEIIRPYLHSRNYEIPEAEIIWIKLSGNKKYNNLQFNKHCSYLYQYAVDFISLHQLKNKTNALPLQYLQILNQRRLTDLFSFHADRLKPLLTAKNEDLDLLFVERFSFHQQINLHQEILQSRQQQLNTADVLHSLEEFYMYEKLKYWSAANHYKNLFDEPVTIQWEEFLMKWINETSIKNEWIEIYRQILLMQLNNDTQPHYEWLKRILFKPKNNLNKITQKEILLFLINYCIAQINSSNTKYYEELFQIYKLALKQQLLIQKKVMSPWDFKNIISVALQLQEIKWTEKFIKTYSLLLPKDELNNAYNYNLAKVFFIQKKYKESLQLLQQVAYTDLFYQLDIKVMQAKTMYELNEWDTLDDLLISLKKMLTRKRKLSAHYQNIYRKFTIYFQPLLKSISKKEASAIIKKLELDTQVPDKNWLMEKLNSLQ
ncbi:MAG: hypothetical protein RIQ33_2115 [Bacteroidota bacterium]|jgi:hypothetical protein